MKQKIDSLESHIAYYKRRKIKIIVSQITLLVTFLAFWEIASRTGLVNGFLVSRPSAIFNLLNQYMKSGEIFKHIKVSVIETLLGLVFGTILGIIIAIALWLNKTIAKILDPFLVVLNALPKTALAPILILWAGAGIKGIVLVAISLSLVVTILSAYNYFISVDREQYKMMQTFGASKFQILTKLVIPSNIPNLINIVKINIGMAWVGVIVGEFLVSREGIGYLVVYGGQVFRLDLVMMGVLILGFLALIMYLLLNFIEKFYRQRRFNGRRK